MHILHEWMLEENIVSCYYYLRMLQKNTKFRYLQNSQIPVMFNYINRECDYYEGQESLERTHDREERIRKNTKAPLSGHSLPLISWVTLGKSIHWSVCLRVKSGVGLYNSMILSSPKFHYPFCHLFSLKRQNPGLSCSDHVTVSHTPQMETQHQKENPLFFFLKGYQLSIAI